MWITFWCMGLVSCLGGLWWVLSSDGRAFRRFEAQLHARTPISDENLVVSHFEKDYVSADVVAKVRRAFAKHTGYPVQKILPDDDFANYVCETDADQLIEALEHEFGTTISEADVRAMRATVRSVSLVMADATRKWKCNAGARVIDI